MVRLTIAPCAYDDATARTLVDAMADDLAPLYGARRYPPAPASDWEPPRGRFVVARDDGVPVGCGGWLAGPGTDDVEIKRVFVVPAARGRGVARAVVTALLADAGAAGARRAVLETGRPQTAALALYRSLGFLPCPCPPPHDADPVSVCLELPLDRDLRPRPGGAPGS